MGRSDRGEAGPDRVDLLLGHPGGCGDHRGHRVEPVGHLEGREGDAGVGLLGLRKGGKYGLEGRGDRTGCRRGHSLCGGDQPQPVQRDEDLAAGQRRDRGAGILGLRVWFRLGGEGQDIGPGRGGGPEGMTGLDDDDMGKY